jgi:hypothetical protein
VVCCASSADMSLSALRRAGATGTPVCRTVRVTARPCTSLRVPITHGAHWQMPCLYMVHGLRLRHVLKQTCNPACRLAGRPQLQVVAAQQTEQPPSANSNTTDGSAAARQMLGMKGAALETDKFKIRVQLTKPVTWVPLIWGGCQPACQRGSHPAAASTDMATSAADKTVLGATTEPGAPCLQSTHCSSMLCHPQHVIRALQMGHSILLAAVQGSVRAPAYPHHAAGFWVNINGQRSRHAWLIGHPPPPSRPPVAAAAHAPHRCGVRRCGQRQLRVE